QRYCRSQWLSEFSQNPSHLSSPKIGAVFMKKSTCERVFTRDKFTCKLCFRKFVPVYDLTAEQKKRIREFNFLVVDHIDKKLGDEDENLQTLCFRCNAGKSGRGMHAAQVTKAIQTLGRPVLSYPSITEKLGSNASIFVAQLLYWTPRINKQDERDGWVYKTAEQAQEETGLTYKEQATARERLVEAGLIKE